MTPACDQGKGFGCVRAGGTWRRDQNVLDLMFNEAYEVIGKEMSKACNVAYVQGILVCNGVLAVSWL